MKLSEMTTNHAMDVLMVAAVELEPLLQDEALMKKLSGITDDPKKAQETGIKRMVTLITILCGQYRGNIYRFLAAVFEMPEKEIGVLPILKIVKQAKDSLNDEELLGFFPQLRRWGAGK